MSVEFTRKGRYRLSRDGVPVSEHNVVEEAYENALEHAEANGPGIYRVDPPWLEVDVPIMNIIAGVRSGGTQSGGGGGGGGTYAATHYVAPFASVPGASNDYNNMELTAPGSWAAAQSSGTPTTLGTAMANAVAGNKVRCGPGNYSGIVAGKARFTASFMPANSGTSGNPIVFFAQYPAATNYGNTALYSWVRNDGTTDPNTRAVLGADGRNHIIYDGFYARYSTSVPGPSEGMFCANNCTGAYFRRLAADMDGPYLGDNTNAIFLQGGSDYIVTDCYFNGSPSSHRNASQIQTYGVNGFVCEYNTFVGTVSGYGLYVKGSNNSLRNRGVVCRYNKATGVGHAFGTVDDALIYQNLVTGAVQAAIQPESSGDGWAGLVMYNNTISVTGSNAFAFWLRPMILTAGGNRIYNNVVVVPTGTSNECIGGGDMSVGEIQRFDLLDYNVYYANGATPRFSLPGGQQQGLTNWRSALAAAGTPVASRETNSISSDPLFVGSGSYKLQGSSPALTASNVGGPCGCYITGNEEIGIRANPTY